jgi:hypothetical protein
MNIRDLSNSAPLGRSVTESPASPPGLRAADAANTRPGAASVSDVRGSQSPVVAELRSRLQSTPDVRAEAVAAAKSALQDGSLLTREAALGAAHGIVSGFDQ